LLNKQLFLKIIVVPLGKKGCCKKPVCPERQHKYTKRFCIRQLFLKQFLKNICC
jgi:hypothetical protein